MTLIKRLRLFYWRYIVPRPSTLEPGGWEKYVRWCANGEQNIVIYNWENIEGRNDAE